MKLQNLDIGVEINLIVEVMFITAFPIMFSYILSFLVLCTLNPLSS